MLQFGRREKNGGFGRGGGVPCFIEIFSSLEGVTKDGFSRGGRSVFFIGIYTKLEDMKKRGFR